MTPEHRYRIVVALDRSEYHAIVLEHALDQAARQAAPDLHFLTVVDKHGDLEEAKAWLAVEAFDGLDVFARGKPEWRARLHVRAGKPAEEIAMLAAELDADLIVLGRFGTSRWSSTSDRILALAPCPLLIVGLSGHAVDAHPQCEKCVEVRAESGGERWFCAEHASDPRHGLTELLPLSSSSILGGPMF